MNAHAAFLAKKAALTIVLLVLYNILTHDHCSAVYAGHRDERADGFMLSDLAAEGLRLTLLVCTALDELILAD